MAILDLHRCGEPPRWSPVEAALAGGITALQLRAKNMDSRRVYAAAVALLPRCREAGIPLIVNDRPDVAVAAGADGAHVGPGDLPPESARAILGSRYLGASARDVDRLRHAEAASADYAGVGAVRATATKADTLVIGVEGVRTLCAATSLPVLAIGGVRPEDVPVLLAAGAWGVAVAGGIFDAPDPRAAAEAYGLRLGLG
jgi:thiamine-phosphate diphosphorylase